jgi:predicted DNA-binding transcriptional regulator AlpA
MAKDNSKQGSQKNETDLMTQDQVASWLQVSNRTLERWRDVRKGPKYRKIGGVVRYVRCEVQAWIDSQTVETNLNLV